MTGLIQDGTVTSGMEWEECKYVPNDLEGNQIRSVSEEACRNNVWKEQCVYSEICVFQNYQKKIGGKKKISLSKKKTSQEKQ